MKSIADTGFIVAFARSNDQHHPWALDLGKRITEPLLTCEAVLAEAAFHLGSSSYVLSLVEDGLLEVAFDFPGTSPNCGSWRGDTRIGSRIWPICVSSA